MKIEIKIEIEGQVLIGNVFQHDVAIPPVALGLVIKGMLHELANVPMNIEFSPGPGKNNVAPLIKLIRPN